MPELKADAKLKYIMHRKYYYALEVYLLTAKDICLFVNNKTTVKTHRIKFYNVNKVSILK